MDIADILYEMHETTHSDFVQEWVDKIDMNRFDCNEFITIGGDGLFSLLINSLSKHPSKDELLSFPFGIIPGGSTNAAAWDLGCKNPYTAVLNIIKGITVSWDMIEINLKEHKLDFIANTIAWGFVADVVHDGQDWRKCLGSFRYTAWGLRHFLWKCWPKPYVSKIYFK